MNPYPFEDTKEMEDYLSYAEWSVYDDMPVDKKTRWLMERLDSPEFLNAVIRSNNEKIKELEEEISLLNEKLNAPLMLKIKWKLASLMNKLPKIRIEW